MVLTHALNCEMMAQLSYVRISDLTHPNSLGGKTLQSNLNEADLLDFKIVDEIIGFNTELGLCDVGGEWKYINAFKRKTYIDALLKNDANELVKLLINFFQTDCGYGITTPPFSEICQYDLESQILWDLDALYEFCEIEFEDEILFSSSIGAPYGLEVDDKIVSPDSPRHLYFAQKLQKFDSDILEIGGGYGGVIYFLLKLGFSKTYYDVDIPETLYIAYYFLRKNNVKCKFVVNSDFDFEPGTVYLVPHFLFDQMQERMQFDCFFNANSLSEMDINHVNNYFKIINYKRPDHILHCNSNYLAFPNSERHIEILGKNLPIDHSIYDKKYQCVSPFQGALGRYREFYYQRKK